MFGVSLIRWIILALYFCFIAIKPSKGYPQLFRAGYETGGGKFQATLEACRQEANATKDDVQDLLNRIPAENRAAKCLRSCLLKKYQLMSSDGKFAQTAALEQIRKLTRGNANKIKLAWEMTNDCLNMSVSQDHCEAAAEYDLCFRQQAQLMGLPDNRH